MDAEIQKSIRDFRPEDPMTHGLWQRLMRVSPLRSIVATVPLNELDLKDLLTLAHRTLFEISQRVATQKALPRIRQSDKSTLYETQFSSSEFAGSDAATRVFSQLAELMRLLEGSIEDDMETHLEFQLHGNGHEEWGDVYVNSVELGFQVSRFRPETTEETAERLQKEAEKKEKQKQARKEAAQKKKLAEEKRDLAELARLKEKYEALQKKHEKKLKS